MATIWFGALSFEWLHWKHTIKCVTYLIRCNNIAPNVSFCSNDDNSSNVCKVATYRRAPITSEWDDLPAL